MKMSYLNISGQSLIKQSLRKDKGGVLIEMSVVLPLCLLFLLGILELGRVLAQYSWVQQTTYNAALLGSGLTSTNIEAAPVTTAGNLFAHLNASKGALTEPGISASYNEGSVIGVNDTVSITIQSDLNLLTNFFPIKLNNTTTAPSVTVFYPPQILTEFGNGNGEFYDCDGNLCAPANLQCATTC